MKSRSLESFPPSLLRRRNCRSNFWWKRGTPPGSFIPRAGPTHLCRNALFLLFLFHGPPHFSPTWLRLFRSGYRVFFTTLLSSPIAPPTPVATAQSRHPFPPLLILLIQASPQAFSTITRFLVSFPCLKSMLSCFDVSIFTPLDVFAPFPLLSFKNAFSHRGFPNSTSFWEVAAGDFRTPRPPRLPIVYGFFFCSISSPRIFGYPKPKLRCAQAASLCLANTNVSFRFCITGPSARWPLCDSPVFVLF